MTNPQRRDRESDCENDRTDLRLLEKYIAAHRRRGTEPDLDTLARYERLKRSVDGTRGAGVIA